MIYDLGDTGGDVSVVSSEHERIDIILNALGGFGEKSIYKEYCRGEVFFREYSYLYMSRYGYGGIESGNYVSMRLKGRKRLFLFITAEPEDMYVVRLARSKAESLLSGTYCTSIYTSEQVAISDLGKESRRIAESANELLAKFLKSQRYTTSPRW